MAQWPLVLFDDEYYPYLCATVADLDGLLEGSTDEITSVYDSSGCRVTLRYNKDRLECDTGRSDMTGLAHDATEAILRFGDNGAESEPITSMSASAIIALLVSSRAI